MGSTGDCRSWSLKPSDETCIKPQPGMHTKESPAKLWIMASAPRYKPAHNGRWEPIHRGLTRIYFFASLRGLGIGR